MGEGNIVGLILRLRRRLKDNIKIDLTEVIYHKVNWMKFAHGSMFELLYTLQRNMGLHKIRKIP
jgi:hypothetical protein